MGLVRKDVERMLYQLGFEEAHNWDGDKLREVCMQLTRQIPRESVLAKYRPLYDQLSHFVKTGEYIVWKRGTRAKKQEIET